MAKSTKPTLEQLVESREKAKSTIEELEAERKMIDDEIFDRLTEMKITGTKTKNGYFVAKRVSTFFNEVEMSTARELGATKMEEKIDTKVLHKLHDNGIKIKGEKQITFVVVKEAE